VKSIIFFSDFYLPGYRAGGPIKSISKLAQSLRTKRKIYIFTRNYDFSSNKEPYDSVEANTMISYHKYNIWYSDRVSFVRIYKFIKEISPDYIYLNSFFSSLSIRSIIICRLYFPEIKLVLAPRGEFSQGALSIKRLKKSFFMKMASLINLYKHITYHATDLSEKLDILNLFNNVNINIAPNFIDNYEGDYQKPYKKIGDLKVVFLSRISKKKNLQFAVDVICSEQISGNIYFDIYGIAEDKKYLDECMNKYKGDNIRYLGELHPIDIPKTLSRYHVFFLPTLGENFGHAIIEAISLGLLPLLSDKTPWNDLNQFDAGWAYPIGSKKQFIKKLNELIQYNNDQFIKKSSNVSKYFEEKFDQSSLLSKYEDLFR